MDDETSSIQSPPSRQHIIWLLIFLLTVSIAACGFLWGWRGDVRYVFLMMLPVLCALIAFLVLVARVITARSRMQPTLQLLTFTALLFLGLTKSMDSGLGLHFMQSRAEYDAFVDAVQPSVNAYEIIDIPEHIADRVYMASGVRFPDGTTYVTLWTGYAFPPEGFGFGRIDGDFETVRRDPIFGKQLGHPIGDGWWIVRD